MNEITAKQHSLLLSLLAEREHNFVNKNLKGITSKEASEVIGYLFAQPFRETAATEAQVGYVTSLMATRDRAEEYVAIFLEDNFVDSIAKLNKTTISLLLDTLSNLPQRKIEKSFMSGGYLFLGDYYQVKKSKTTGTFYAKKWDGFNLEWKYVGSGVLPALTFDHRLSQEQAQEFGRATNHCIHCGKAFKDEQSREAGIGKTCRLYYVAKSSSKSSTNN